MRRLFLFCTAIIAAISSFAAITYELNGGVTNDDNWLNKGDMFTACMTDAGVSSSQLKTLEYVKATSDPFSTIRMDFPNEKVQVILESTKWDWLEEYVKMVQDADETASILTEEYYTAWGYALAAFFLETQRTSWPRSADFTFAGTIEAFQRTWKHAYANPTAPEAEFVLNAPYKEGATFDGWYAAADFSGDKVTTVNAETTGTLYAKWVEYVPTIAEVMAMVEGTETKVAGVVNWVRDGHVFIQDYTGGFLLYGTDLQPEVGQKIVAKGTRSSYYGSPRLSNAVIESTEDGELYNPVVTDLAILVGDATGLKYFGQRVKILGVRIEKYDEYGNVYLIDGAGASVKCHYMTPDQTVFPVGRKVNLTAVASQYNGTFHFEGDIAGFELAVNGKKDTYVYPERHEGKYKLTNTWVISNNEDNFAANKPGPTDYVRGMAVKDGKMYFINRETQSITVVDGLTGEMLDPIILQGTDTLFRTQKEDGTWGSGCTLPYNDIKFDDAGNCLIGCTMGGLTQTFFIYLVDLETGEATEIVKEQMGANPYFETSFASGRIDAFGAAGNVLEDGVIMAAENQGTWNVYRWGINGGVAGKAEEISIQLDPAMDKSLYLEAAGFGTAAQIFPQDETGSVFYVDGFNTLPMRFNEKGKLLDDFIHCPYGTQIGNAEGDTCNLRTGHNGLCEFQVGDEYFLLMAATNTQGTPPSSFALYKFADEKRSFSSLEPLWYFPKNGMGMNTNGCRTAVPSVEVVGNTAYMYVYTNNNGYARYELKVEKPTYPVTNITVTTNCGKAYGSWESEAPYFEVQIYDNNDELQVKGIVSSKNGISNNNALPDGEYRWVVRPMYSNQEGDYAGEATELRFTMVGCVDIDISRLTHTITEDTIVQITWESEAPIFRIWLYDYEENELVQKYISTNTYCDTLSDVGRYIFSIQSYNADTTQYSSLQEQYIEISYGDWAYDLNFTYGTQWNNGSYNNAYQRPIDFYSTEHDTKLRLYPMPEHENSVVGTYIIENNASNIVAGNMWGPGTSISYHGINTIIESGVATILRNADGRFVVYFDLQDASGNSYTNTCTLDHIEGSNVADDHVTALNASEALTLTQNLTQIDSTYLPYFVKGIVSNMRSSNSDMVVNHCARFDISDDGSTTNQFYCYNTRWVNDTDFTTGNEIALGDTVVVCGHLQNYLGTTPEIKGYVYHISKKKVESSTELDLQFTHGYVRGYAENNKELHLYSNSENTEMVFDLYSDYTNSILGTYIVSHSNQPGYCYTNYSKLTHNGNINSLSSGVVTVIRDALGNFVISFDVIDVNGNTYTNECTIAANALSLYANEDITGYNVTALTATEAAATTVALPHYDMTTANYLVKGVVSEITSYNVSLYNQVRFYISEDGTTSNQFYCYNTRWLNNTDFTTGNELAVGDTVVVCGRLQNYLGTTPEIKGYVYQCIKQARDYYTLSISSTEGGSVTTNPALNSYPAGTPVTVTAIANEGYHFSHWNDGNTNSIYIVTMDSDITLHAIFVQDEVPGDNEGGDDNGDDNEGGGNNGDDNEGEDNTGGDNEGEDNTGGDNEGGGNNGGDNEGGDNTGGDNEGGDNTGDDNEGEDNTGGDNEGGGNTGGSECYILTLYPTTPNTGEGGYAYPAPSYDCYEPGTSVEIHARANMGYRFVRWNDGNTQADRTITMNAHMTFTAHFEIEEEDKPCYILQIAESTGGHVIISPEADECYEEGSVVSLTAVAYDGYTFAKWNDGITSAQRSITMDQDYVVSAIFNKLPTSSDITNMKVTGSNLTATARWESTAEWFEIIVTNNLGNQLVNEQLNITGDNKKYVYKAPKADTYTISVEPLDNSSSHASLGEAVSKKVTLVRTYSLYIYTESGGTVNEDVNGNYAAGEKVDIVATPKEGYIFMHWDDGNTEAKRTLTMDQDYYLAAIFKRIPTYTLTIYDGEGCTADIESGTYTYQENEQVVLNPIVQEGYIFSHWMLDDTEHTEEQLTIIMSEDHNVYPVATAIPTYKLTIIKGQFGKASIEVGEHIYPENTTIELTPIADEDYIFDQWLVNGKAEIDSVLTLFMIQDYLVEPIFKPNTVGIKNVLDNFTVDIQNRSIIVQATYEQDMKLYDLVGRLLDQKKHTRTATFNVHHAGLYLLQTNNGIKKIKIE